MEVGTHWRIKRNIKDLGGRLPERKKKNLEWREVKSGVTRISFGNNDFSM